MAQTHAHALPPSTRIDSYEIAEVLGVGSFGITYKAHDHTLDRTVAVKEYLPSGLAYRESDSRTLSPVSVDGQESYAWGLRRFLDEARVLARFNEPSIIRVIRYLEANGTAYFVMDYVAGESLFERVRRGPLSEAQVRGLLEPLLQGLGTVHGSHYLHRDIKPHNIYLRGGEFPILLDFGCARQHLGQASQTMTVMGSPAYAPFEQMHEGVKPLPSADIYSLGATAFHCVAGRPPPPCTRRISALHANEPDPLEAELQGLAESGAFSEGFLDVLDWMLSPQPADRPQTTADVLEALEGASLATLRRTSRSKMGEQTVCDGLETLPVSHPRGEGAGTPQAWSEEMLQDLEAVLARFIGPRAMQEVRPEAKRHSAAGPLVEALAGRVPEPARREAFRARVREVTGLAVPEPRDPALDPDWLETLRTELAEHLGPIAGILVKRHASAARTPEQLVQALAAELPGETGARETFLKKVARP